MNNRNNNGEQHYNWKGGKYLNEYGHIMVRSDVKLLDKHQGYITEHKDIMQKFLKRELTSDECIIHINGNVQDNRIENLKLVSRSEQLSIVNTKNMDDRFCYVCGSFRTYQRKDNGKFTWYYIDKEGKIGGIHDEQNIIGYVCVSCYARHRRKSKNPYKNHWHKQANLHNVL